MGDADGTTAEEIYSDPGHSEADIYSCFEKKKFRMIKRNDIRWATYTELGVTCYKRNSLCNIITFTVTSNIMRYMPL